MGFWDRMQEILDKSIETSKDVFDKAKEKAKELGEKGVLKYEIMKVEKQIQKKTTELGAKVFDIFSEEKQNSITKNSGGIKEIVLEIANLEKQLNDKEEALKNL